MPKTLETKQEAELTTTRHCTQLIINLPIGQNPAFEARFTVVATDEDGVELSRTDGGSAMIPYADVAALPAFADAYAQMSALVHAKRDEQDPVPQL